MFLARVFVTGLVVRPQQQTNLHVFRLRERYVQGLSEESCRERTSRDLPRFPTIHDMGSQQKGDKYNEA